MTIVATMSLLVFIFLSLVFSSSYFDGVVLFQPWFVKIIIAFIVTRLITHPFVSTMMIPSV